MSPDNPASGPKSGRDPKDFRNIKQPGASRAARPGLMARIFGVDYYWPALILGFAVVILLGVLFGQYVAHILINKGKGPEQLAPVFETSKRQNCAYDSIPDQVKSLCSDNVMTSKESESFCKVALDTRLRVFCFNSIPVEIKDFCRGVAPAESQAGNDPQVQSERKFCTEIQELSPTSIAGFGTSGPRNDSDQAAETAADSTAETLAQGASPAEATAAEATPETPVEPEPEAALYASQSNTSESAPPAAALTSQTAPPPSKPNPAPTPPTPAPRELSSIYRVQVGIFRERENADKLVADLAEKGYVAAVGKLTRNEEDLFRVQVGAYSLRENAEKVAADLSARGYKAVIVSE